MNQFLLYLIAWFKSWDAGEITNHPDPDPPADLGSPLTQDEIDFVKKLKKEVDERFTTELP